MSHESSRYVRQVVAVAFQSDLNLITAFHGGFETFKLFIPRRLSHHCGHQSRNELSVIRLHLY